MSAMNKVCQFLNAHKLSVRRLSRACLAAFTAVCVAGGLLVSLAPALAVPLGHGFTASLRIDRSREMSIIWKAKVICRVWTEGRTKYTTWCEDGFICGASNKCLPGPEMQRKIDDAKRQLEQQLQQFQAAMRSLRQQGRRSLQAPLGSPNNSRTIQTYLGKSNNASNSGCSTITGLPGPAPSSGSCNTSGPIQFDQGGPGQRGARSRAPNPQVIGISQNLPPGWIASLAPMGSALARDLAPILDFAEPPAEAAEKDEDPGTKCRFYNTHDGLACEKFYKQIGFCGQGLSIRGHCLYFKARKCGEDGTADCKNACVTDENTCNELASKACWQKPAPCCDDYLKECE
jgi:hypothetical protein